MKRLWNAVITGLSFFGEGIIFFFWDCLGWAIWKIVLVVTFPIVVLVKMIIWPFRSMANAKKAWKVIGGIPLYVACTVIALIAEFVLFMGVLTITVLLQFGVYAIPAAGIITVVIAVMYSLSWLKEKWYVTLAGLTPVIPWVIYFLQEIENIFVKLPDF